MTRPHFPPFQQLWKRLLDDVGGADRLRIIVLLGSVLGLDAADKGTVSAVSDALKGVFHIGNTEIGLLFAAVSFVGAAATLPMGILADRLSRKHVLMVAISLWCVAMLVSASATSFIYLLITRLALGVVTAAAWPCVASLTGDFFPAGERSKMYGLIVAGELIGIGVGFFVSSEVSAFSDWRWSFVVMASPALLLVWVLWRYLPEPDRGAQQGFSMGKGESGDQASAKKLVRKAHIEPREELVLHADPADWSVWRVVGYLLRMPTYTLLIVASALVYYFFAGARSFAMIYLTPHYQLSRAVVGALVFVLGIGALIGVVWGGRFSERMLRKGHLNIRIVQPAVALLACVPLLGFGVWTRTAWIGIPLLAVAACLISAAVPPIDAARLDIVHPRMWGRGESGRMAIRSVFEGGAPLLFGAMSGWLGGGQQGLMWTFLIMLFPMLLASGLGWWARDTYLRDVATAAASLEAIAKSRKR
ncbi:MAG: MFS transporter [Steroidobacteraceae bacterium]